MTEYLEIAIAAAREAGELLRAHFGVTPDVKEFHDHDIKIDLDGQTQELITKRLLTAFPDHALYGEEGIAGNQESEWHWIVDPIDGTVNYFYGLPHFCVSIALRRGEEIVLGVIYDPMRDELFTAERGQGAALNGRTVHVSQINDLNRAMLCTGFPYDVRERSQFARHFTNFIMNAQAVRRDGTAALDLAYVACGRFDGFWEEGLRPWDVAAGVLLIEEAGGRVSRYDGAPFDIYHPPIVASNGLVHDAMMRVLGA